jgi:hypothetical protein
VCMCERTHCWFWTRNIRCDWLTFTSPSFERKGILDSQREWFQESFVLHLQVPSWSAPMNSSRNTFELHSPLTRTHNNSNSFLENSICFFFL